MDTKLRMIHERLLENKEGIIEDYKKGIPLKEMAERYKISIPSVCQNLRRWDIPKRGRRASRNNIDQNKTLITNMYRRGDSIGKIAEVVGIPRDTITYNLIKWGLKEDKIKKKEKIEIDSKKKLSPEDLKRREENTIINRKFIKGYDEFLLKD
jgi:hypothetical protein